MRLPIPRALRRPLRALAASQNEKLDVDLIDVQLHALPQALDGYRLAVVSDLHIRRLGPYHESILRAVRDAQPDVILILGDTMDEETELIDALAPFFAALAGIAPAVAILGNNDCLVGRLPNLRAMYRQAGVTLLENEARYIDARGVPLQIAGLMDPSAAARAIPPERGILVADHVPLSRTLPPQVAGGGLAPSILLVHQPQLAVDYAVLRPSLMVAGHAHGGQVRLPGIGGLFAPGQGWFPRLTSGLYRLEGSQLVVSRGLGNHRFPLRLNNRPHLPVIVLRPEGAQSL